jgi:hypothetical protein
MDRLEIFRLEMVRDFFRWHPAHLPAGNQVGAEALEMAANNPSQFARRFFAGKGNLKITPRKLAIVREEEPGAKAQELAETEKKPQRKRAQEGRAGAVEKINAEIEHAEPASRGRWICAEA